MTFREKLVALRRRDGLTQTALAREVGVTRQAVYLWEKGLSYPEAEALLALRRLFGVSIDTLLDDGIALPDGVGETRESRPKGGAPAPKPVARPAPAESASFDAGEEENERFFAEEEKTPAALAKKADVAAESKRPPAPPAAPAKEEKGAPLRAKIEPTKRHKSGSILDLVGAFWRKRK